MTMFLMLLLITRPVSFPLFSSELFFFNYYKCKHTHKRETHFLAYVCGNFFLISSHFFFFFFFLAASWHVEAPVSGLKPMSQ